MKEETETKQAGLPALISLLLMADVVWLPASSSCLLFLCCDGLGADAGIWVNLSALSSFFPACFIPATETEQEHWLFPDFIEKKGVSRNVFSGTQILKGASLSPRRFSDARQMNSKRTRKFPGTALSAFIRPAGDLQTETLSLQCHKILILSTIWGGILLCKWWRKALWCFWVLIKSPCAQ